MFIVAEFILSLRSGQALSVVERLLAMTLSYCVVRIAYCVEGISDCLRSKCESALFGEA